MRKCWVSCFSPSLFKCKLKPWVNWLIPLLFNWVPRFCSFSCDSCMISYMVASWFISCHACPPKGFTVSRLIKDEIKEKEMSVLKKHVKTLFWLLLLKLHISEYKWVRLCISTLQFLIGFIEKMWPKIFQQGNHFDTKPFFFVIDRVIIIRLEKIWEKVISCLRFSINFWLAKRTIFFLKWQFQYVMSSINIWLNIISMQ